MRTELLLAAWLALWALIAVVALVRAASRRVRLRMRYGGAAVRHDVTGAFRKMAPYALLFGATTCLLLLFAQIRLERSASVASVVLAIDVSDSMLETDVQPDRLSAAKAAATTFLDRVPPGFRVGVVTFADAAHIASEPGESREATAEAIDELASSRGTVIGDGLSEALDMIVAERADDEELPAAIVLLTDGADTGSAVPPDEAAERAQAMAVPVFTVAIVGNEDEQGGDIALLESIASGSGGALSTAASAGELSQVYETLGARLSSELTVGSSAMPLLAASVLLTALAVAAFLGVGRRR